MGLAKEAPWQVAHVGLLGQGGADEVGLAGGR